MFFMFGFVKVCINETKKLANSITWYFDTYRVFKLISNN